MSADWHRRNEIEALTKSLYLLHRMEQNSRQYASEDLHDHPPQRHTAVREMMDDPLGRAYRAGIREIGERLYQLGGNKLMEKAASITDENWYANEWDGIGGWWS